MINNNSNLENKVLREILEIDKEINFRIGSVEFDQNYLKKSTGLILEIVAKKLLGFKEAEMIFLLDDKKQVPEIGKVKEKAKLLVPIASIGFEDDPEQQNDDDFTYKISEVIGPLDYLCTSGKPLQLVKDEKYIENLINNKILKREFWDKYKQQTPDRFRNTYFPIVRMIGEPPVIEVPAYANFGLPDREIFDIGETELLPDSKIQLAQTVLQKVSNYVYAFGVNQRLIDINRELIETQEQLIRAEKLAAQGTLVFGLTHDFRNLFTPVQNTNIMLSEDLEDIHSYLIKNQSALSVKDRQAFSKYMEILKRNKKDIRIIIDQTNEALKRIDEIDIGSGEKKIEDLCLENLAENSLQIYSNELKNNNISVETNYESQQYKVLGSKYEISSIFNNLISNSIDALAKRPDPKIKIVTQLKGNKVIYTHEDNGCGMSEETKKRAFDMFYSTKSVSNGRQRGIGLYQVATYALGNGSNVTLESEEGKYTKFTLDFLAKQL